MNGHAKGPYSSLTELTKSYGVSEDEIISKLEAVGYHYDTERNAFVLA